MNFGPTIVGQQNKWNLVRKLGEGDAGEVYLVESLVGGKPAILKRPRKGPFYSDVLRQASQIRTEGNVLTALSGISFPGGGISLSTPALLDQSLPEEGLGERFFIIIGQAAGIDLKSLENLIHFGQIDNGNVSSGEENRFFIQKISEFKVIPEPILVRSLYNVILALETIHSAEVWNEGVKQYGLIWNDIKPEHLYWDPVHSCLTVIDWGNAYFLEADGATKDRQHSCNDDYYQFVQAMGEFLTKSNPELYARLEWPQEITPGNAYSNGVKPLKDRLISCNEEVVNRLQDLRKAVSSLYGTSRPELDHLSQSDDLQHQIVAYGELPDFSSALNFHARVALKVAGDANLEAFQKVCERAIQLASVSTEKWDLLGKISSIFLQQNSQPNYSPSSLADILSAGVADDWPALLWGIFELVGNDPLPDWWEKASQDVRKIYLKVEEDALTPYTAVSRLYHTLRAVVLQMEDDHHRSQGGGEQVSEDKLLTLGNLLKIFNDEVMKKWKEIDPAPPNAGVGYHDIDGLIEEIENALPGNQEKLEKVLAQPKAQAAIFQDAWERKDFETARKALRILLLWDPDRRRLLRADQAIRTAPQWLSNIRKGAGSDEPFYDYLTSVELAGRNLRNHVGQAEWLDLYLDILKRLRKGIRPADLIMDHLDLMNDIPWLNEHRSREVLSLAGARPLLLERDVTSSSRVNMVAGIVEGKLGKGQDMFLTEPLDTWIPEARGSSARVFAGTLHRRGVKHPLLCAVKVMRPDQLEYALPLFIEEAQILSMLRDVPGVTPMVECGYLRIEEGLDFPGDRGHASAQGLHGQLIRYGVEEVQNFLASVERYLAQGWLPYLALIKRDQEHNLMKYCDAGYTHGWFLPLRESLLLAIQICDILQSAHDRNIVYRDHKILHYYWDPESRGVVMIDWNIAKRQSQGLSDAERQFDLVQFGARALHHILTGRPAPGALPLGPNRPEEIEHASLSYSVNWTYDDERLPNRIKEILEQVLAQGFPQFRDLRMDLFQVYQQIPESASGMNHTRS